MVAKAVWMDLRRCTKITGGAGEIGFISPLSQQFCESCNRLRLTANGHLRACLLSDEDVDLRGPLRSGCTDRDLAELIEAAIAKKPIQHPLSCDKGDHIKKCMKDMSSIRRLTDMTCIDSKDNYSSLTHSMSPSS